MNKAFVKEPEQSSHAHCPRCGSLGIPVSEATLISHVQPAHAEDLGDVALFCPFAKCEVAYFDHYERLLTTTELSRPIYPKDADAPMCGCSGLTVEDVEDDLSNGTPARIRELLKKSQSPAAQCVTQSPSGRCCLTEVQRYYFRRKQELAR